MKYFAYGSNMLSQRLTARVSSAAFLTTALLRGYALRFHKRSKKDGSGKCDALHTGDTRDVVYGAVFEIDEAEKADLDRHEGLGNGYDGAEVEVETDGGAVTAFTYLADRRAVDGSLKPYTWYKDYVVEGAKQNSLPPEYVASLEQIEAMADPDQEREAENRLILARLREEGG
jgi:gamma-glutamylcyclotransferase